MDNYELPKIAVRKLDPSSAKKLQAEAKASKVEENFFEGRGRENVVGASVEEQEKEKETEAEVKSFQLDFGEFPLNASLLVNGPYARRVASKLIFPADAERFGNTSDALLADHLMTASIVTNQISCEAARRFLAVETRAKKYEEENRRLKREVLELDSKHEEETRLLTREVLELESKLINATTLCELTKEELDLLRAKTSFLEDSAHKNGGNNLKFKEYRIQELELELKSTREAAKKEKDEAINTAYQRFVKDLAQRDEFLAAKYYTKGRNSAKLQIKERADVEMSEVELDSDYDDYQSDVNDCPLRERQSCERLEEIIENDSSMELHIRKRQRKVVETSKGEEKKTPVGTDDESDKHDEMEEEENEKSVQDQSEDEKHSSGEEKENESEEGSAEDSKKRKRTSSSGKKESAGKKKAQEAPITQKRSSPPAKTTQKKSHPNSSKVDVSDESPKVFSRKNKDVKIAKEEPPTPKSAPKEKSGKKISKVKETPSDTELRDTMCEILKEIDFNTATFTDILKRLGKKYKKDLTSRKASIKQMIQEELTKLADEADEDDEEEDEDSEGEKDENKPADHKVKA